MSNCPNPEGHDANLEFYGECTWCGAAEVTPR